MIRSEPDRALHNDHRSIGFVHIFLLAVLDSRRGNVEGQRAGSTGTILFGSRPCGKWKKQEEKEEENPPTDPEGRIGQASPEAVRAHGHAWPPSLRPAASKTPSRK